MEMKEKKLPWCFFLFLFIIFYFATPYDLLFSIREASTAQTIITYTNEGELGRRVSLFVLGFFGLFSLFATRKSNIRLDFLAVLIFCFIYLALVSVLWSDDKLLTIRKIVVLAMFWAGAAGVAIRYSLRDISLFIVFSGLTTIILGLFCEVYLGTFHPFDMSYRFAGTLYPNTQGMNCAILGLAAYSLAKTESKLKHILNLILIVSFIFLFLTKSRASFVSVFIAISAYWIVTSSKDRKLFFLVLTIIFCCILGLFVGDTIFEFIHRALYIGRDVSDLDSFAMRMPLWQECMHYIAQQPIQGFGYESFWTAQRVSEFSREQGWAVAHSHSGYIQLTLGLGITGLLIYITMLFVGAKKALLAYSLNKDCSYLLCFSIILSFAVNMIFENVNVLPFLLNFLCITLIIKMSFLNIESIDSKKECIERIF